MRTPLPFLAPRTCAPSQKSVNVVRKKVKCCDSFLAEDGAQFLLRRLALHMGLPLLLHTSSGKLQRPAASVSQRRQLDQTSVQQRPQVATQRGWFHFHCVCKVGRPARAVSQLRE